ncbi:caspase family protein [Methylobacterium nonmethylotrophicum]|uniref:Caspase family p20 domain-containing protein n=1 Tax=Methylobacterium nonmethylotrophicum TaxID=1141884 RepID=A0A4Z0NW49_9HYPH|nr:caspase domain-containing protein [Methylobacterium nonmethylotrophicum]TGE01670.1 hypothetical protein EU555_03060 [Methylobacterium nonmethylotrophicum]
MHRSTIAFTALLILCASIGIVHAEERRTALVIGVSSYDYAPRLSNTLNDAKSVSQALQRLGFSVQTVLDPNKLAMEVSVRQFGEDARKSDVAVFFYAGHALEVAGRSWLLPVTTRIENPRDLRFEALDLEAIMEQTESGAKINLIFLDACRDNPLQRRLSTGGRDLPRAGLGQVSAGVGTLIAFATAPGMIASDGKGPNSPFTTALLKYIEQPGLEIRQMLSAVRRDVREMTAGKQIPWENSALEGEFFFQPKDKLSIKSQRSSDQELSKNDKTNTQDNIITKLHSLIPGRSLDALNTSVREYIDAKPNKAIAISYGRNGTWKATRRNSQTSAIEGALEGCQVFFNDACALVMINDKYVSAIENSDRPPVQYMSRPNYDGIFKVERIPNLTMTASEITGLTSYMSAPAHKAAAFHPWGRVFLSTGKPTLREAEDEALRLCNSDPDRNGRDGKCYLYAAEDMVVLKDRIRAARQ